MQRLPAREIEMSNKKVLPDFGKFPNFEFIYIRTPSGGPRYFYRKYILIRPRHL